MGRSRRTPDKLTFELLQASFPPRSCKRCEYVFVYPEDAPWNQVIQLVCGHWKSCLAGVSGVDRPPSGTEVTKVNEELTSEDDGVHPTTSKRTRNAPQEPLETHKRRKKNVMDEMTRKQLIERDSWGRNATSKSVECKGCGKTIKLDKRSQYYPGLWHKHRNKCPEIRRLEAQSRRTTNNLREPLVGGTKPPARGSSPSSSEESVSERSATQERVLRWTATLGPQYDGVPPHTGTSGASTLEQSDCGDENNTASRTRRLVYAPNSTLTTTTSSGAQCSDEESYWETAPFGPGKGMYSATMNDLVHHPRVDDDSEVIKSPEVPEQRPRLYRYSTRRELVNRYNGGALIDNQGVTFSEDVIQAALCLVSMKSRASVS